MKKLLYVLDDGMRKFTYEWVEGMRRSIQQAKEDIELFIVRADTYAGFSPRHNRGECNIYRLPDYRDFDGILLDISNAFQNKANDYAVKGVNYAVEAARASGKPVISMANYFDGCHYVGIDNYAAMTSVIRHLHEEMGLTDFWFAMGPAGNSENQTRTRALRDYCISHDLPCEDGRFHAESFAVESGVHAFEYLHRGGSLPQAVICANDEIAWGVCRAAKAAGCSVPGDFKVTGFDNLEMSAYLSPSMTTVDQKRWNMGRACIDAMLGIWRGEDVPMVIYTPTELVLRETTGHVDTYQDNNNEYVSAVLQRDARTSEFRYKLNELQYQLPDCESIREICQALAKCLETLDCKGIRLVLDQKLFETGKMIDLNTSTQEPPLPMEGYSDSMELVYSWTSGQIANLNRKKVGCTLPTDMSDPARETHLFVPLHFKEYAVGYLEIRNCPEVMRLRSVSTIVNTLTQGLRTYFNRRDMRYVNRMLSGLSMTDNLTGLYNRLGYHNLGHRLFNEVSNKGGRIGILFIDMDRLKEINDTLGHASGDHAICCVANAIKHNLPQGSIPVRFGGDEFLALLPVEDRDAMEAVIGRIRAALPAEAEQAGIAYVPEISVGYVLTDPSSSHTIDEYVESADNLMYQQKREKHA
ncbi:MAG: GGDEF domain-containing protein [Clostridia bacterium]|nr:GGDEF domain-containing protein [Clostridia bacterium]